jgi:adenylylsulfate kinase-like enzyme
MSLSHLTGEYTASVKRSTSAKGTVFFQAISARIVSSDETRRNGMKKPCLYLLCGLPFAGKTTLAKALVRSLGIHRVAIDDINNERGIWDEETGLSPEEWTNTYQEAYRRIAASLKRGESVIDDSANFTRELRQLGQKLFNITKTE